MSIPVARVEAAASIGTDEFVMKLKKVSSDIAARSLERTMKRWRADNPALYRHLLDLDRRQGLSQSRRKST